MVVFLFSDFEKNSQTLVINDRYG